ncbi:MAG: hypothetical protein EHM58_00900 [Ignavibacteriae bacterium]|nr:MAG: hypothetical protein EHM58_00900 [Ignavibacteriota bacterium]
MQLKRFSYLPFILFLLPFIFNNGNINYSRELSSDITDSLNQDTGVMHDYIEFIPEKEIEALRKAPYLISVNYFHNANEFMDSLKSKGFTAEVYKWEKDPEFKSFDDYSTIWLGNNVPVDITVEVIQLANNFYPHLKYIHISGDKPGEQPPSHIHNNVFIGGATSTALEYKLKALTHEDFMKINSSMTKEELHKYIRGFYTH